jgi:hypothetical protein
MARSWGRGSIPGRRWTVLLAMMLVEHPESTKHLTLWSPIQAQKSRRVGVGLRLLYARGGALEAATAPRASHHPGLS